MLDDEKPNETPSEPDYTPPTEPSFPNDRREKSEGEIPKTE